LLIQQNKDEQLQQEKLISADTNAEINMKLLIVQQADEAQLKTRSCVY